MVMVLHLLWWNTKPVQWKIYHCVNTFCIYVYTGHAQLKLILNFTSGSGQDIKAAITWPCSTVSLIVLLCWSSTHQIACEINNQVEYTTQATAEWHERQMFSTEDQKCDATTSINAEHLVQLNCNNKRAQYWTKTQAQSFTGDER